MGYTSKGRACNRCSKYLLDERVFGECGLSQRCELLPSFYTWGNRYWKTGDLLTGGKWRCGIQILPFFPMRTQKSWSKKMPRLAEFFLLFVSFSTLSSSLAKLSCGFQLNLNLKDLLLGQFPPKESGWLQEDHSLKGLPPAPAVALCPGNSNQHCSEGGAGDGEAREADGVMKPTERVSCGCRVHSCGFLFPMKSQKF